MYFLIALLMAAALPAVAQGQHDMANMPGMNHDMSHMAGMTPNTPADAPAAMETGAMETGAMASEAMDSSGTARNPASAPMDMLHFNAGRWMLMFHGMAFVSDVQTSSPRGGDKLMAVSWAMGTAEHALAGGAISFRSMLSLDPLTVTGRRYPELFQTGETAYGVPIVDGQHPHDFVMELAVAYTHSLGAGFTLQLYGGPVGDPAMGPVAYPHRASAEEIPQATITHHLIDSTHVSDDVVTAGIARGWFRLEASGFHGGEPNENRWNIDHGAVDSYSARLSVTPSANWTGQFSAGRLTKPEALEPGDQTRLSASVTYNRPWTGGNWATSAIWGRVHKTGGGANLNGYLLETLARFRARNIVSGRLELADKNELFSAGQSFSGQSFRVGAYTAGYTRDVAVLSRVAVGLGANFTAYGMPAALHSVYGARPVQALVFVRFRLRPAS